MLKVTVPGVEYFNNKTNEIVRTNDTELQLEHSLLSISKWEAKWHKPFISNDPKTADELIDYIRCMTVNNVTDQRVYTSLRTEDINKIKDYIDNPMTATWFSDDKSKGTNREIVTSELVYYWMIALQIPFECQKWHINRLLTLIRICNIKNDPDKNKKMSKADIMRRNAELNAKRRAALHTKG